MEIRRFAAVGGTLALHGLAFAVALTMVTAPVVRELSRPVEVALLRPPEPEPVVQRIAPKRPEPLPVRKTPAPTPPQAPPQVPPPLPQPAVVSGKPVDEARPASITAAAAPATAPAAARVTEGLASTAAGPFPREAAAAAPQRTGPRFDASWSGNAPPPYPAMARRMGDEGEVRLDVHVGPDGWVTDVRLKKSSGSRLLDQTAIDTVKKWRFSPATVDGKPVAEWYHDWKWVFKLES